MNGTVRKASKRKHSSGFTLVELIIVIAVLGMLAAIAVPNLVSVRSNAQSTVDRTNARLLANSVNSYNILYGDSDNAIVTVEQIRREFMIEMWPDGLTSEEAARAVNYITIQDMKAQVVD